MIQSLHLEDALFSVFCSSNSALTTKLRNTLGKFVEFWAQISYFWLARVGRNHFVTTKFSKLSKEIANPTLNSQFFCTFGGSDREEQHERPQTQIPLAEKAAAGNPFPFGGQLETEEKTNVVGGGDDARSRVTC